jgi:hypothetical protein
MNPDTHNILLPTEEPEPPPRAQPRTPPAPQDKDRPSDNPPIASTSSRQSSSEGLKPGKVPPPVRPKPGKVPPPVLPKAFKEPPLGQPMGRSDSSPDRAKLTKEPSFESDRPVLNLSHHPSIDHDHASEQVSAGSRPSFAHDRLLAYIASDQHNESSSDDVKSKRASVAEEKGIWSYFLS